MSALVRFWAGHLAAAILKTSACGDSVPFCCCSNSAASLIKTVGICETERACLRYQTESDWLTGLDWNREQWTLFGQRAQDGGRSTEPFAGRIIYCFVRTVTVFTCSMANREQDNYQNGEERTLKGGCLRRAGSCEWRCQSQEVCKGAGRAAITTENKTRETQVVTHTMWYGSSQCWMNGYANELELQLDPVLEIEVTVPVCSKMWKFCVLPSKFRRECKGHSSCIFFYSVYAIACC